MKITELSKILKVSRPTIYKCIEEGLTEQEIIDKYTPKPIPIKQEQLLLIDLKEIKKIVKTMILEYQNSLSREIKFSDVDAIYEIVKKY